MFLKTLLRLIIRIKREIIIVFVTGTFLSFSEILLVTKVLDIYEYLLSLQINATQSQIILILAYIINIFLGLIMVYFVKFKAFKVAFNLCIHRAVGDGGIDFVNKESALNNLMTIERERLSREIIAPLFIIFSKIALPVVTAIIIIPKIELTLWTIAVPFIAFLGVFAIASSFFARFARKLEITIRSMGAKLTEFVKLFTPHSRLLDFNYKELEAFNHDLAILEGKIDGVSQLPRQALDVAVMIIMVLTVTGSASNLNISVLISMPLLVRSLSYFQAIYKAFASLRSNIMALSATSLTQEEQTNKTAFPSESKLLLKYCSENREIVDVDSGYKYRTIGIKYPSGYGKSNAILNLLYETDIFPSRIDLKILNLESYKIGFIPSEPYFNESLCHISTVMNLSYPEKFLPQETSPQRASAGERFRWALVQELAHDIRLLIIDESIASLPAEQRDQVFELCMNLPIPVCLMIISHSDDILLKCDKIYEINK